MGLSNILKKRQEQKQLPASLQAYADSMSFPTVRSVCMARPEWCIVEADYQTAEMRGLAFIAGDKDLMRMILEPDDCFGIPKPECLPEGIDAEDCVVRLKYPDYVMLPADKDKFILTYAADGEIKATFTEDQLQRNPDGSFKGPRFDMHWGACELSRNTCREVMNKKKDRGAAKVVNFSSSYGGTATSISRKIEADTGIKATPEEAQALLDAVEQRQPRATEFFKEMEKAPELYGQLKAASGRIRHCHMLAKDVAGMTRTREGQLTALGRECRNFFMQESVGASASRACVSMVDFHLRMKEQYGLQGYPCVCLYDSIVVHCPVEERHIWAKALDLFMNLSDGWYTPGGILRYPTDCEFNAGWSTKPDKEFKKQLHDADWNPTPSHLKPVEDWLDAMIQLYTDNPDLSVYNKQDKPHE